MFKFSFIYIGSFCFVLSVLSFFNIIYSYYFEIFNNIEVYTHETNVALDDNEPSEAKIVLSGTDNEGLVYSLTEKLAEHNINIIEKI